MRLPFALAFVSAAAATARRQGDDNAIQLRGGASSTAVSAPRSSSSQTHPASNLASAAPRLAEALVHPDAVVDLVTDAPLDPAAHPELLAASDETGSDDEPRPSPHVQGRALQSTHAHYVESACNADLSTAACVDWSDWINGTDISLAEVKIPCGACVTLDASPGQPLFGSTLQFGEGINVVGKLVIPNDANVDIVTKYVYVQGELAMPAPAAGSSTGISSAEGGSRTKITLYGNEELTFVADEVTDNSHLEGKGVSSKAFVVAGGKVDIAAIDPTCPSWVKLQSVQYGTSLPNVALGKTATQSSTYNNIANVGPESAVDGNDNSFMHTFCWQGINQWWEVDLADTYTVSSLHIVNRLDCCGGRLHDFDIFFLDENKNVVDSIFHPGWLGSQKDISVDRVNARYVKIQLGDQDCLQLGEVEVFGWLASESVPVKTLDVLTLGDDAARCWGAPGSRLMLTSDTYDWNDSHVVTVADVPGPSAGKVYVHPLPKKKTAVDETFGYPDFAVEVALLDRSLIIEGAEETGEFADIGGHIIVLHTPHVQQHLEGALLQNMGQMGRLGRYPVHFHMSESVYGSTIAKNVIYKSNQRCIVVHGSHNVTVSENVAYDTKCHCYMLEDGGEWDNTFSSNLGALTKALPRDIIRPGETDHRPSTYWVTNPSNHWVGNVAAGAAGPGFWFELKLRGPSADLAINQDVNPK